MSLFVHVILVILGGSVVLFHREIEPPDFAAGEGSILTHESTVLPPPSEPESQMMTPTPVEPKVSSALISAITVSSPSVAAIPATALPALNQDSMQKAVETSVTGKFGKIGTGLGMKGGSMNMLGQREKLVSAFVGRFYDLKQTKARKPTDVTPDDYHKIFRRYISENWKESNLATYFRARDPIYATQIFTPNIPAVDGPKAFGLEKEVQPSRWLVHYRARVSPPEDGNYHFVGAGDDVMLVKFNGKLVLDRCWHQQDVQLEPEQNYDYGWSDIPHGFGKGSVVHARAGQYYDMDVLIGEEPGGRSYAALLIEKEGAVYEKDKKGNPILPVFRLADGPLPDPAPGQSYAPHAEDGPVWKAVGLENDQNASGFDEAFGKQ